MAVESDKSLDSPTTEEKHSVTIATKKKRGVLSRICNALFRRHRDDNFEEKLKHISKEEAAIVTRIKKRTERWSVLARNLTVFSLIVEVVGVSYAIMATRTLDLGWKTRALRVLPMFLFPVLSTIIYLALGTLIKMRNHKDQINLERLKAEKQENLDELKVINNYYMTQQLIQKYDTDPAERAAAATILASRLDAESNLRLQISDDSDQNPSLGRSNDVELVQSSGLRHRRQILTRSDSNGSTIVQRNDEDMAHEMGTICDESSAYNNPIVTGHQQPGSSLHDGGWFARLAAMLVGEDPTQCYALICGNCHMHNGLARKEEFPYITYYCPHCNSLNRSNNLENTSDLNPPPSISSSVTSNDTIPLDNAIVPLDGTGLVTSPLMGTSLDTIDGTDATVSDDTKPDG